MTTFTFISDPGHGWLMVSPGQLADVGLTEADITPYSYRNIGTGTLALEEDCDAGTFLDAWKAKNPGDDLSFMEVHEDPCPIRNWPSFGSK